jgi:hypothetical protein
MAKILEMNDLKNELEHNRFDERCVSFSTKRVNKEFGLTDDKFVRRATSPGSTSCYKLHYKIRQKRTLSGSVTIRFEARPRGEAPSG